MDIEAIVHIARFELQRTLRDPYTWIGVAAFVVLASAGACVYWQSLPPRPPGARVFGEAYLLGLVIAFHTGIARDRQYNFDQYLAANFEAPAYLYFGHIVSALMFLLSFGAGAFLFALALSLGDLSYAAEYPLQMLFASLLMLPFIVALELMLNSRLPVPVLLIIFFVFLVLYARIYDVNRLSRVLGLEGTLGIAGVLLRVGVALLLTAALYPLFVKRLGWVSTSRFRAVRE
ncbi:MAG TPA: hypothetical protein VGD27_08395 [Longimicrobiales bacterium]